ncbi:hypothetical protein [Niallia circulans]|nr:hypothetical protein [Niallia circulans]
MKSKYEIIGYVDNDKEKWGKKLESLPNFPPNKLLELQEVQVIM